jgi:hypothetical protein
MTVDCYNANSLHLRWSMRVVPAMMFPFSHFSIT